MSKNFLNFVDKKNIKKISANEGCAVSIGIGYHFKNKENTFSLYAKIQVLEMLLILLTSLCAKQSLFDTLFMLIGGEGRRI